MKKFLNGLGVFGAIILSIVLVIMLICSPIYFAARSITLPKTYTTIVKEVGFGAILGESDNEEIKAVFENSAMSEVLERLTEDLVNLSFGRIDEPTFTVEEMKEIINSKAEDFAKDMRKIYPELEEKSDEDILSEFMGYLDEDGQEFIDEIAANTELNEAITESEIGEIVPFFAQTKYTVILISALVVIAALIFVFRLPKLGGLIWLAVDSGIGAVITFGLYYLYNSVLRDLIMKDMESELKPVLETLFGSIGGILLTFSIILFVVTVACIVLKVLYNKGVFTKKTVADCEAIAEFSTEVITETATEQNEITIEG